jgi:hypothetical protein
VEADDFILLLIVCQVIGRGLLEEVPENKVPENKLLENKLPENKLPENNLSCGILTGQAHRLGCPVCLWRSCGDRSWSGIPNRVGISPGDAAEILTESGFPKLCCNKPR